MTYSQSVKKTLWNFIASRLFPFLGISIAAALLAHKNINDLPLFSYVLAVFSVVSILFSMPLAAVGNIFYSKKDSLAPQQIFEGGLAIAVCFSFLSLMVAALVLLTLPHTSSLQDLALSKVTLLSMIYIPAIPLLIINTFSHIFHESSNRSQHCATLKKWCTLTGCLLLSIVFLLTDKNYFAYFAIGYFPFVELILFFSLAKLSIQSGYNFTVASPRKLLSDIISLGFPIAAGMAGQKIYYYLLNEKLLSINEVLAGDLSICMSIIGFLSIPLVAFAQLHSIYASKNIFTVDNIYGKGLAWCLLLIIASLFVLYFSGALLFYIFGNGSLHLTDEAFVSLSASIISSGCFSLTASHLRALKDTLIPQLLINSIMLAGLIPVIYLSNFNGASIYTFILLQSSAVFIATFLLQYRVYYLCKNRPDNIVEIIPVRE